MRGTGRSGRLKSDDDDDAMNVRLQRKTQDDDEDREKQISKWRRSFE